MQNVDPSFPKSACMVLYVNLILFYVLKVEEMAGNMLV